MNTNDYLIEGAAGLGSKRASRIGPAGMKIGLSLPGSTAISPSMIDRSFDPARSAVPSTFIVIARFARGAEII